jgi:hypothetical protein
VTTKLTQTLRHGDPLTFSGSFGRAEVARMNGLWRVKYDGRADWFAHLDHACTVADNLSRHGEPPSDVPSLLRPVRRAP